MIDPTAEPLTRPPDWVAKLGPKDRRCWDHLTALVLTLGHDAAVMRRSSLAVFRAKIKYDYLQRRKMKMKMIEADSYDTASRGM